MSEIVDASFDELNSAPKKRPVFLTVLCILTFVGSGLGFLSALYGLLVQKSVEASTRAMQQIKLPSGNGNAMLNSMIDHMDEMHKWTMLSNYLSLGATILGLTGALLMWNLRKAGFFIYTVGQVLPLITLFCMYSVLKDIPMMGFAMIIGAALSAIFAIGFVVMYGLNLKHMR